jgi:glucose/arabinose dehydrogenase
MKRAPRATDGNLRHGLAPLSRCIAIAVSALFAGSAQPQPAGEGGAPPRPPAGAPAGDAGSPAPDGYTPLPQWAGQTRAPAPSHTSQYELETVVTGITQGFSFAFLPDGRLLLTERPGAMRIAEQNGPLGEPLAGLPQLWATGPQGLLDVRLDRDFATNRTIYFSYTAPPPGAIPNPAPRLAGVQHVARARLSADFRRLEDVRVLLNTEGIEGRLVQAPDGTLIITSGVPAGVGIDSADWPQPQQLDSKMGKVLRINTDGSVPRDNPFVGRADAHPEIYALGLREDQGLDIHPRTGKVWASSNGPKGGDEINVIERGKNYGFPIISYGREYSGKPINGDLTTKQGMEQPVYFWTPSIAPSGIHFYTGDLFPDWRGDLFVAAMAPIAGYVVRLELDGERVVAEERLFGELGTRFRDVHTGPDGALYVLTKDNVDAKIVRVVPRRNAR